MFLKQSTASQEILLGPFLDDTDGKTAETGLTIANTDIKLWKSGGTTESNKNSGGATHIASGRYYAVLDATDTDTVGLLEVSVSVSGALPVRRQFYILEEAVYDALFGASAAGYQVPIWSSAAATVNLSATTIKTATDIEADTVDIQSRLPATLDSGNMRSSVQNIGAVADGVWDEPYAGHTTAGTFGKLMDLLRKANLTIDGTVSNAITPTTLTFSSNVAATTSAYAHAVLLFVSGPLTGENSPIISYNSTNGVFVLEEALTAAPSNGDEFVVIAGSHVHAIADIQSGLATLTGVTSAFTEIKGAGWSSATDTLEQIADAAGGGGGSTVIVSPLQAVAPDRVSGTEVMTFINDVSAIGPIAVTDADGVAVDLSALTLKVCIEKIDGTILANVTPSISGASNNQITFTPNADSVAKTGTFRWSLRRTSNNQVYAYGDFVVDAAARIS
jgi:hypothetical protein